MKPWTEADNARRCKLIALKSTTGLTRDEDLELEDLQWQMIWHRRRAAPLPLEDVRELHSELKGEQS